MFSCRATNNTVKLVVSEGDSALFQLITGTHGPEIRVSMRKACDPSHHTVKKDGSNHSAVNISLGKSMQIVILLFPDKHTHTHTRPIISDIQRPPNVHPWIKGQTHQVKNFRSTNLTGSWSPSSLPSLFSTTRSTHPSLISLRWAHRTSQI